MQPGAEQEHVVAEENRAVSATGARPPAPAGVAAVISPSQERPTNHSLAYERANASLNQLSHTESVLSESAGHLLEALQTHEARANRFGEIATRIRADRKRLLSRITKPSWERAHHYHMTAMEHYLGRRQPNVVEVAGMLPGHLRILATSHRTTLFQKCLVFSMRRERSQRDSIANDLRDVCHRLRRTRDELHDVEKLVSAFRKARDAQQAKRSVSSPSSGEPPSSSSSSVRGGPTRSGRSTAFRMKYMKALNLAASRRVPHITADRTVGSVSRQQRGAAMNAADSKTTVASRPPRKAAKPAMASVSTPVSAASSPISSRRASLDDSATVEFLAAVAHAGEGSMEPPASAGALADLQQEQRATAAAPLAATKAAVETDATADDWRSIEQFLSEEERNQREAAGSAPTLENLDGMAKEKRGSPLLNVPRPLQLDPVDATDVAGPDVGGSDCRSAAAAGDAKGSSRRLSAGAPGPSEETDFTDLKKEAAALARKRRRR